jgi:DNA-directed RNA polymerase specialized sigma24 family protein
MPKTDDELIEGTIRRDPRALRELLLRLRPLCARKLLDRFGRLRDEQADLLDEAESLLFEWSCSPRARALLPAGEDLGTLAFRLISRVVDLRRRDRERQGRLAAEVTANADVLDTAVDPEVFGTTRLVAAMESLPDTHRKVLIAELCFQLGDGPPLAEALGANPASARVRLHNARAAMLTALEREGTFDSPENDHG